MKPGQYIRFKNFEDRDAYIRSCGLPMGRTADLRPDQLINCQHLADCLLLGWVGPSGLGPADKGIVYLNPETPAILKMEEIQVIVNHGTLTDKYYEGRMEAYKEIIEEGEAQEKANLYIEQEKEKQKEKELEESYLREYSAGYTQVKYVPSPEAYWKLILELEEKGEVSPGYADGVGDGNYHISMGTWHVESEDEEEADDVVNHPSHYTSGKIEVIDFIHDQDVSYCLGNVLKYVCRAKLKGKQLEDLKKAAFYLAYEIKQLEVDKD